MQVWHYHSMEAFECADSAFSSPADQYAARVRLREVGRKKEGERWNIYTDVI